MRSKKFREMENPEAFRAAVTGEIDYSQYEQYVNQAEEADINRNSGVTFDAANGINDTNDANDNSDSESVGTWIKDWIKQVVVAVIIAIIIMQFIKPTIVKQHSMEPSFYTNDYLLVNKQAYKLFRQKPQMGEVIIFETEMKTENGDDKLLIKRVIGLPGDVITITGGKCYVNGEMIDDSYTKDQTTSGEIVDLVVPENKLFCMGDNRLVSVDSRSSDVGFVDYDQIIGKVVFRVFPIKEFGTIYNPYK